MKEKTALVRLGLEAVIARESSKRLAGIPLWTADRALAHAAIRMRHRR